MIESDPPGAAVWINEHPVGRAPVTREFITHGRYLFRLTKPGFRELTVRERVRAPIHQWIPLDFVTENLLPFKFQDVHIFRYTLSPQPPSEKLQEVKPETIQQWVKELRDPDPAKRRSACVSLASQRDPSIKEKILEATRDPDPMVRAIALGGWRGLEGSRSMERLSEALLHDPSPQVRWQAAVEMEALHDRQAVAPLMTALKDRDPLVRTGAAEALKSLADPQALQVMIFALRDKDTSVRRAATEGLGRIADRAAVKPLIKVLFHHDFQTRRFAVKSLAQLKDPSSGPALVQTFTDWDKEVRKVATDSLIAFGDERVIPVLIRRLRGLKPWTRMHAAQVLGGLKDPRAVEPLARAFRQEMDPPASEAMFQALVALGAKLDESWSKGLTTKFLEAEKRQQKQKKESQRKGPL